MLQLTFFVCLPLLALTALLAWLRIGRWVPWLVPVGWAAFVFVMWVRASRGEGETQEGLIAFVGLGVLAVLVIGAVLATGPEDTWR